MTDFDNLQSLTHSITAVTSPFRQYLHELHKKYHSLTDGVVANYIPELALANPDWFGIAAVTPDGQVFEVGDSTKLFTSQAISKAFVYGLALEDQGQDYIDTKVGLEPTGEAFNAIVIDETTHRPHNPMINGGAIAITSLIKGKHPTERLKRILDMFQRYTGHPHDISMPVFLSEKATSHRNRAMAFLLLSFGIISDDVEEILELYFQQCSILVNARDLAMMASTLANGGVNPVTQERAIAECHVQAVISVMLTCGLYDYSGEWAWRVGMPAKSGVGGGITAVVPGQLGIGTFSPPLDAKGNSVRGIQVCKALSQDFGLHLFNRVQGDRDLASWIKGTHAAPA